MYTGMEHSKREQQTEEVWSQLQGWRVAAEEAVETGQEDSKAEVEQMDQRGEEEENMFVHTSWFFGCFNQPKHGRCDSAKKRETSQKPS